MAFYSEETSESDHSIVGKQRRRSFTVAGSPVAVQEACEAEAEASGHSRATAELGNAMKLNCLESIPKGMALVLSPQHRAVGQGGKSLPPLSGPLCLLDSVHLQVTGTLLPSLES